MLTSQFKVKLHNGQDVPVSWCNCYECGNTFMVPHVPENEPRYCCYCGTKFLKYETSEGDTLKYDPSTE